MLKQRPKSVSNLTNRSIRRRETGAWIACLLAIALPAAANDWHPAKDITATAESFLEHRMSSSAPGTTVATNGFDNRNRLARCDKPLQGFLRNGTELRSRTIVGVRCSGSRPWKVYVPVDVVVLTDVLVAARPLPRGHVLSRDDVRRERHDVAKLRRGYLGSLEELAGQRLKAPILAGSVLTPSVLESDQVVRRGQTVTLIAAAGGIAVNMRGTALADGGLNQRIRVENLSSGRIVEGVVRSSEHVEVLLPGSTNFFNARPKVSPQVADIGFSNNDR